MESVVINYRSKYNNCTVIYELFITIFQSDDTYVFKGPENQISVMFLTICYLKYFEYDKKLKRYSPGIFKTAQHLLTLVERNVFTKPSYINK